MRISDWSSDVCSSDLALGLDAGYASRILRRFEAKGWIERGRGTDARQRPIFVTDEGKAMFAALDDRTRGEIERQLADRKGVVQGKRVSVRVNLGGLRIRQQKKDARYILEKIKR